MKTDAEFEITLAHCHGVIAHGVLAIDEDAAIAGYDGQSPSPSTGVEHQKTPSQPSVLLNCGDPPGHPSLGSTSNHRARFHPRVVGVRIVTVKA
jgi:hypothetical protein